MTQSPQHFDPTDPSMLAYSTPLPTGRPGLVTAVGIMSIVLGSLGVLCNAWGALQSGAYFMAMRAMRSSAAFAAAPPTAGPGPTTMPNPAAMFSAFSDTVLILSAAEAIVSLLFAILLIVLGILVLRGSAVALRWHRVFAWLKIPFAAVSGFVVYLFYNQVMTGSAAMMGGPAPDMRWVALMYGAFYFLMGVLYPIGLLIVLRVRSVREYENRIRSGT